MLENPFKKTINVDDEVGKKKSKIELCIYAAVFLLVLVVFAIGSQMEEKPTNNKPIEVSTAKESKNVIDLLSKIADNYSLVVKKYDNEVESKLIYSKDKDIEIYESKSFTSEGYVKYNNNVYTLTTDKLQKLDKDETKNYFNSKYYNMEFISNTIKASEKVDDTGAKATYKILLSSMLKEYNYIYETTYKTESDKYIEIIVNYSNEQIKTILIDYTYMDELINKNSNSLSYHISVSDIDNNDYSNFISLIEK